MTHPTPDAPGQPTFQHGERITVEKIVERMDRSSFAYSSLTSLVIARNYMEALAEEGFTVHPHYQDIPRLLNEVSRSGADLNRTEEYERVTGEIGEQRTAGESIGWVRGAMYNAGELRHGVDRVHARALAHAQESTSSLGKSIGKSINLPGAKNEFMASDARRKEVRARAKEDGSRPSGSRDRRPRGPVTSLARFAQHSPTVRKMLEGLISAEPPGIEHATREMIARENGLDARILEPRSLLPKLSSSTLETFKELASQDRLLSEQDLGERLRNLSAESSTTQSPPGPKDWHTNNMEQHGRGGPADLNREPQVK